MTTATKYKKYPKYKPSGIDWLGDIPEGWDVKNVMYQYRLKNGYAFKTEDFVDDGVPIVKMSNLKNGWLDFENSSKISEDACLKDFEIKSGDLLIGLSGSIENFATAKDSDLPCQLNQRVGKFLILDGNSKKFLQYFLESKVYREQVFILSNGSTIMNVSTEQIEHLKMFVPSVEEQKSIADFLDRETAKIDEMVAKKQKMIDLLKEKRQALITHAVTKGIDPKAKMKPSGIDWLGDIPEGWEVKRLGHLLDYKKGIKIGPFGSQLTLDEMVETGYKVYGQENVINNNFELGKRYITGNKFLEMSVYEIRPYDLLITMMGTTGNCQIVPENIAQGIMDSHLIRIRFNERKIVSTFAQILVSQVHYVKEQIDSIGQGSIMSGLNSSIIKSLIFIVPPIREQAGVIDYIVTQNSKINKMIKKVEMQIEKLQEYRQALITSAVTGKIKI